MWRYVMENSKKSTKTMSVQNDEQTRSVDSVEVERGNDSVLKRKGDGGRLREWQENVGT